MSVCIVFLFPFPNKDGRVTTKKGYLLRQLKAHPEFFERLEAMADWLNTRPEYAPDGHLKAGERLRLAFCVGIQALEQIRARQQGDDEMSPQPEAQGLRLRKKKGQHQKAVNSGEEKEAACSGG